MDQTVVFKGDVNFRKWYFVPHYQYRILIETSATHWRKIGQPAAGPQRGDEVVPTVLDFFWLQEEIGILEVKMVDQIAALLFDNWLGEMINKIRKNKQPYENVGLLLHPNRLV